MSLEVLTLLNSRMADNRFKYARKLAEQQEAEQSRQQHSGVILGHDSNQQAIMVLLDESDTAIACENLTTGEFKQGQRVLVSIPHGASKGFVDGMPT